MRILKIIQGLCIHICIICSLTMIVVQILDWYNPFMDFAGHTKYVLYTWCAASLIAGLIYIFADKKSVRVRNRIERRC